MRVSSSPSRTEATAPFNRPGEVVKTLFAERGRLAVEGFAQAAPDVGVQALGQMGQDIATLVHLATPHDAALAVDPVDGAAQRLRPVDDIALTVIALLPERMAEHACADTWRNIRDDLKRIQLAQLIGPNGTLWQDTEPRQSASNRLKSRRFTPPSTILPPQERLRAPTLSSIRLRYVYGTESRRI